MGTQAEAQLAGFLAKYTDDVQAQFRLARKKLRARFPRGYELVYDNYNALVAGYSAGERASQAVVSIAAYPRWVTLFFLEGAALADPAKRLQGAGSTVRSVKLVPVAILDEPAIGALLEQAIARQREALGAAPRLQTIVKSVAAKQRARTPAASSPRKRGK